MMTASSTPVVVSVPALSPAYYGATSPMTTMPTSPSFSIENILAPRPYAIPHPRHGHTPYLPLAPHPAHFPMLPPEYHHLGKLKTFYHFHLWVKFLQNIQKAKSTCKNLKKPVKKYHTLNCM